MRSILLSIGALFLAVSARAQQADDTQRPDATNAADATQPEPPSAAPEPPSTEPEPPHADVAAKKSENTESKQPEEPEQPAAPSSEQGWDVSLSGYFRAPIMLGLSNRPDPSGASTAKHWQVTHAPNRLLDANYNAFSYTRLQEGDWAEVYVTAKRPHIAATVALMGYWYTWAGYENPSAGWLPAQAWVELDSDVGTGALQPHVKLQAGVFWQRWGMFEKYDTYMFGRFHQAGAALEAGLPIAGTDAELRLVEGFGTNRNGGPGIGTGLTLLHYTHVGVRVGKVVDAGLYYNSSWTADPSLFVGAGTAPEEEGAVAPGPNGEPGGGSFVQARDAQVDVLGADLHLRVPHAGHGWLAASRIHVENGWALPSIVEVLHSPGGLGLANNYLAYGDVGSSGSGSLFSIGALYENSLQAVIGAPEGSWPDLAFSAFAMMVNTRRDLSPETQVSRALDQLKWGSDLTLKVVPWLAFMLRYDSVDLDANAPDHAFRIITPRVTFTSHILSTESIWLQYSRYFYEDLALETSPTQPYVRPDQHVIKLQANLSF